MHTQNECTFIHSVLHNFGNQDFFNSKNHKCYNKNENLVQISKISKYNNKDFLLYFHCENSIAKYSNIEMRNK